MAHRAYGFRRLAGAMQSRVIPAEAVCRICASKGVSRPATHVVLSVNGRNYACTPHAEQGKRLGYEVFEGHA